MKGKVSIYVGLESLTFGNCGVNQAYTNLNQEILARLHTLLAIT